MNTKNLILTLLGALCASAANAAIIIDVGDHVLLPGTANQQIDILVSADPTDSLISGSNLVAEIGDGTGPLLEPVFQGVGGTLDGISIAGSVFDVPGGFLSGAGPAAVGAEQFVFAGTTTPSDVAANGALVSFFVDTTAVGAPGDVFPLRLDSFVSGGITGATELLGPIGNASPLSGVIINNGSLRIAVPEPSAALLMLLASGLAATRRNRS